METLKPSIYTSGPIEFSNDAYAWRNHMYRELHTSYYVIIPDLIPCPFTKKDPEYPQWIKRNFILPDMKDVAICDYFFVYVDHVYSSGTYGELSLAAWLGKNITCFLDDVELTTLPMWVIGCLSGANFVNSIEEAIKYYKGLE
jgi:nucleoside 2-deoxyribosyltransferase